MSVVSSVLSTGSSRWNLNDRFASLMDSIFAIGAGLGVRFVVDAATRHNFKLTGSLVGLWEGIVLLHFLKKMPHSNDPYIAYGVRLFVDFLVTESVARFVVVVIWTGMGMVLADIAPAVWDDAGAKRIWRHFRRDIRTIRKMIPTVAFFPPARTVRFSPSLAPTETVGSEALTPSAFNTTELTPVTNPPSNLPPPTTNYTEATTTTKRQVPGYFPSGYSDTDSLSSIGSPLPSSRRIPSNVDPTRTSRRLSVYPTVLDDSDGSSQNGDDLDEGNLSSASDTSTEVAGPSASSAVPIDTENIPEIEAEEEPPIQVSTEKPEEEAGLTTPRSRPIQMPPTPSDSAARWDRDIRDQDEPLGQRPKSEFLPQIPDFLEEPTSEDWEKIKKEDWMDEKELPPTPTEEPPEETKAQTAVPEPAAEGTPSPEEEGWDTMRSQVLGDDNDEAKKADDAEKAQDAIATNDDTQEQQLHNRESQPPPYQDDFDDIYGDEAPPEKSAGSSTNWLDQEEARLREQQEEERRVKEEEEERLRKEAEEEARLKKEAEEKAEADRIKVEEEEKQKKKEDRKKRKQEDAAERKMKEEADEQARKKKRDEEATEKERRRKEEEDTKAKEAEERKKAAEEAEARRQKVREEIEAKAAAETKRLEEEAKGAAAAAETKRLEEEVAKMKRLEEEATEKKRLEEATEKKRLEEAEAEKKRLEEEEAAAAEKKRLDDEAAATIEKKRLDDEVTLNAEIARLAAEEDERLKTEAEQQRAEERELKRQEDEEKHKQEQADLVAADAALAVALEAELKDAVQSNPPDPANVDQQTLDPFSPADPQGSQLPPPPPPPPESVISEASTAPVNVEDRIERMLLLRAQMVEIEKQIEDLKEQCQDTTVQEKVLRKMQNKTQRRYEEGTRMAKLADDWDVVGQVSLENMNPQRAEQKVLETLEQLLSPTARSLSLKITLAKKANDAKRQKPFIVQLLDKYNLTSFTTENAANKKLSEIDISEEDFAEWLTGYRVLLTRRNEQEQEEESPWGYR